MILATVLLLALTPAPCRMNLTVSEAKGLALLTPNAIASVRERGAKLDAEVEQRVPHGWLFRVYATNSRSPSSLIGYYTVDSRTGEIRDWVLEEGPITNEQIEQARRVLERKHCSN